MVRRFGRGSGTGANTRNDVPGTGLLLTALSALVLPIWLLALAGWVVQLAGLAAIQKQSGRHFLQFDWFVTSFELVALLLMPFHLIARRSSPGIAALKGVVTVLEILRTNVWNDVRLGGGPIQIDSVINPGLVTSQRRVNTLFAGYLITSFFNLLLILALGSLPATSAQDGQHIERKARAHMDNDPQATGATMEPTATAGHNGQLAHGQNVGNGVNGGNMPSNAATHDHYRSNQV